MSAIIMDKSGIFTSLLLIFAHLYLSECCEDIHADCELLASQGKCLTDKVWMMGNCRESCNWCPVLSVCEGQNKLLKCPSPDQGIRIVSATWGRHDDVTCPHESINSTSCFLDAVTPIRDLCQGRSFCYVTAANLFQSDPCPGTYKYLQINYYCQECENFYPSDTECLKLKVAGKCTETSYKEWMTDQCFRTCTGCHHSECTGEHEDFKDCDFWALRGECQKNPKWMFENCPMSCRICSVSDNKVEPLKAKEPETAVVCEAKNKEISCGSMDKSLEIISAMYGRQDNETCPHETVGNWSEACSTPDALARLQRVCNGRMSCILTASNNFGDDPCINVYKYLQVTYTCRDCTNGPEMTEDEDSCATWSDEGQCQGEDAAFMDTYCYKSCTNCSKSECVNPYGADNEDEGDRMCDYWAVRGECEKNPDWMEYQCPMSCHTCSGEDYRPPPPPGYVRECSNVEDEQQCAEWFRRGECEKNPSWMWVNCYKSCSRCDCENKENQTQCETWDSWGECSSNEDWMWNNCYRQCSYCEGIPVTDKAWMDFSIGGEPVGRVVFGLFGDTSPVTVKNFIALANETYGYGYRGSSIHRVEKGFVLQGGGFDETNEFGGKSIYGRNFDDENFIVKHYGKGWINMANAGPNTNQNQFAILTRKADWLNWRHVVFSKVLEGYSVLEEIENTPVNGNRPRSPVIITDVGVETVTQRLEAEKKDVLGDGPYCLNKHPKPEECEQWAVDGDCYQGKFVNWMWGNCYHACSRCDKTFTANDWSDLTTIPVAVTTPRPLQDCVNTNSMPARCEGWASRGECDKNPDYMYEFCYEACTRCEYNGTRTTTVCEGDYLKLHCEEGEVMTLDSAFYGRADLDTCSHPAGNVTSCSDEGIMGLLGKCNGMYDCYGTANTDTLGDPCPGVYKYLTITYTCKRKF